MAYLPPPHEMPVTEVTIRVGAIDKPFGPAQVVLASRPQPSFI
jgi:hypothetical protein